METFIQDELLNKADSDEEDNPFSEYANWDEKDSRKPGQSEEVPTTEHGVVLPKRTDKKRPFTRDEVNKLRDLASKQAANIVIARNHYADPRKNPRLHRESQLHLAHDNAFKPMHDAWSELSDSDSYKKASLPQKHRMQRDFINQWHQENPEHYQAATDAIQGAHEKGSQADLAHTQEEKRRLEHSAMGGGLGSMTSQEAAAHLGVKGDDDEMPQTSTSQSAGVKFAGANPEAVKQALSNKRFEGVPEEDIEIEENTGRAPIKKHPDFEHPENKALINDFASRYAHLQDKPFIDRVKQKAGISDPDIDDAAISDASHNAMWLGMHQYNASRSNMNLDQFIKNRMVDAVKNNIKQQHTDKVTSSAKRAAKQMPAAQEARTAGVKVYTPEERAALQAKMTGQPVAKPAVESQPKPEAAPVQPAPTTQPVSQPVKPHFSEHLDDAAKERLKNVNAAKTIIRRPGGQ